MSEFQELSSLIRSVEDDMLAVRITSFNQGV